jgi:mono/diheme cytochrome c family protein
MQLRRLFTVMVVLTGLAPLVVRADDPPEQSLERRFADVVKPFLSENCTACHGVRKKESKLDLSVYSSVDAVVKDYRVWDRLAERLEAGEMPPEEATRQPKPHERRAVIAWISELRASEARRHAGDPGPVLAHRLSNAEFDYTIRDLTGVDIRPTREFPVDPANEAGFDNSGESLAMSPALVKKYLAAARLVADHLVLMPDRFVFAPHPAVTDTDRDKFCVRRIIDFYRRHEVDYADYFLAAWRYQHRAELGKPQAALRDFAEEAKLSHKYLATVWAVLTESGPESGPLGELRALWRKLPPGTSKPTDARRDCERMRDLVHRSRKAIPTRVKNMQVKGISNGSQPFVLWNNRQLAAQRMRYPGGGQTDDAPGQERFCSVFPDTFFVTDRAPYFEPKAAPSGRLLTAGFHLMQGYFRDDAPLCELVLDEAGRRELDALWYELDFVASIPMRQYHDFIFFERAEPPRFMQEARFDFARVEDKDATSEAKMTRLKTAHVEKARKVGADDRAVEAIEDYYAMMSARIRRVEKDRKAAEPRHLEALAKFAERAYRRPLSNDERDDLLAFYRESHGQGGLGHEDAIRDAVASILLSPHFAFRIDPATVVEAVHPLSDYALASRLSYFLWSSMPDEPLLAHAAAGDLHKTDVLVAQARRMLQDDRVRGLSTEFAGNWLEFRRFEEHNGVDRQRFTGFTNDLRQAMYEEPIRFFLDIARRDGSVLEFLDADHTFVNPILAKHYGIPLNGVKAGEWVRVNDVRRSGRGGLLPMSVFLTSNSPGLRTSPVKRGYWVVRRMLGESIPPPPPGVPELPKDEAKLGELTLPQLLARHRDVKECAGCHRRFDTIGLAFEGYGPIGERRERDLGGHPVDARATFPDGSEGTGLDGLRRYLSERRQEEFVANLCRKLLAYALGRSLIPSDQATIEAMRTRLSADSHRFGGLIETIVTSPQFLNKRG